MLIFEKNGYHNGGTDARVRGCRDGGGADRSVDAWRPRAGLEEEICDEARTFTDRRLRDLAPGHRFDLTYTSVWDVDRLLSAYRGKSAGAEVVGAAHYVGLVLSRAWESTNLRPRFVEDPSTDEVALEFETPEGATYRQRYLRDVCGLVANPPEALPIVVGHAAPAGPGGLLPRYLFGAVLARQPWADGDWPRRPPTDDLARLMNAIVWLQESSVRHHFPDMTPPEEPVIRATLAAFLWPPLGYKGNPHGGMNLAALADVVRSWGEAEVARLRRTVTVLVQSCDADLAYLAGAMARAMRLEDDDVDVAQALAARGLSAEAYPPGLVEMAAERLGVAVPR